MNKAAQALGRLAKGKPKSFSKAERGKRRAQMLAINAARSLQRATSLEKKSSLG